MPSKRIQIFVQCLKEQYNIDDSVSLKNSTRVFFSGNNIPSDIVCNDDRIVILTITAKDSNGYNRECLSIHKK